ncbi:tricorn protease domain 2-containing protein, partial [Clathrospora elynae]
YDFPIEPVHDFERADIPARLAEGYPKDWPLECDALDFGADGGKEDELAYTSYYTAVSVDKKLLAISTSAARILIYDIESKELRQVLEGVGSAEFRPTITRVKSVDDTGSAAGDGSVRPGYTLVSSNSDEASRGGSKVNQLILWDLDQHGRILDEEETIEPDAFAKKAIDAIAPELAAGYEWTREFIDASTLHVEFTKALSQVATDHRRRHNTVIDNANLGSFGSTCFSSDGKLLLYHSNYRTTQHGMREPEKLPQVVIYDVDAGKEMHRLSGHTDAIMWSAVSSNDEYVASVSWDGTLLMYSASTGELTWVTADSGGQSWAGAFSPDSKFIAWSSKSGKCRCLEWHPTKPEIALCVGKHTYVWDVFDGPDGKILQHFVMDDGNGRRDMADVQAIGWMDEGRLLFLEMSEGTKLVYDTQSNAKELFRRPMGVNTGYVKGGFYGVFAKDEQAFYMSVDGDGKARFWRTSVAAFPSWWEKEPTPTVTEKKPFPETGKYVKATKRATKRLKEEAAGRDTWAEKGAGLWTAE